MTEWWCATRTKKFRCPASVAQVEDKFQPGRQTHNHPPQPDIASKLILTAKVKAEAVENMLKPASAIVNSVLECEDVQGGSGSPRMSSTLVRTVNRLRRHIRSPQTPRKLSQGWKKNGNLGISVEGKLQKPICHMGQISRLKCHVSSLRKALMVEELKKENCLVTHSTKLTNKDDIITGISGDFMSPNNTTSEDYETGENTFTIITGASNRGKDKLVDRHGFSYTVKRRGRRVTEWWCSTRTKKFRCPATVLQKEDMFRLGLHTHSHPPKPGIATKLLLTAKVKSEAREDLLKPASAIIGSALRCENLEEGNPSQLVPTNLMRIISRARKNFILQPSQPEDCEVSAAERNTSANIDSDTTQPVSTLKDEKNKPQQIDCENEDDLVLRLLKESLASAQQDDEYDAIGKNIAAKLRKFPNSMRIYAEKLISDVLYEAEIGSLNANTKIVSMYMSPSDVEEIHTSNSTAHLEGLVHEERAVSIYHSPNYSGSQ